MQGGIRVAVMSYGNVGKAAINAIRLFPDLELGEVITRRKEEVQRLVKDAPVVSRVDELKDLDVVVLGVRMRDSREGSPRDSQVGSKHRRSVRWITNA